MKKLSTIFTAVILTTLSATAFACPKGTVATGGTGPNHKGGTCVTTKEAKKHAATHHEKSKTNTTKEHSNMIKPSEKNIPKADTEMNKTKMDMNKDNTEMNKPNIEMNQPKP